MSGHRRYEEEDSSWDGSTFATQFPVKAKVFSSPPFSHVALGGAAAAAAAGKSCCKPEEGARESSGEKVDWLPFLFSLLPREEEEKRGKKYFQQHTSFRGKIENPQVQGKRRKSNYSRSRRILIGNLGVQLRQALNYFGKLWTHAPPPSTYFKKERNLNVIFEPRSKVPKSTQPPPPSFVHWLRKLHQMGTDGPARKSYSGST